MEGQPISVEALERPVEENRPPPNPVQLGKLRGDDPKLDRLQTIQIWIAVGGAMTI